MVTTIQVSNSLLEELKQMKLHDKESYEEIIWDMIEDRMELSKETKQNIEEAEADIKAGRTYTHKEVKEALGLCTS